MKNTFTTKGFADYIIETRGTVNIFLDKIGKIIDWKNIEKTLEKKYKKRASADGRPAYPSLPMFKLLLLQCWYGLSDPAANVSANFFSSRPELECPIEDVVHPAPISANYAGALDYMPMTRLLYVPIAYQSLLDLAHNQKPPLLAFAKNGARNLSSSSLFMF